MKGNAPEYTITSVTDFAACGTDGCQDGEDAELARRVEGTVKVPCYLDQPGCPTGSRFNFANPWDRTPTQIPGNTIDARLHLQHPALGRRRPRRQAAPRPSLYGHGLLGDRRAR